MSAVWSFMILAALAAAAFSGKMGLAAEALLGSGAQAVELMMTLLGTMGLWGGLMEILSATGDLKRIGSVLRRILLSVFPGVNDERCWQAMSMNLSANLLGLGNAATPAGMEAARLLAQQGGAGLRALAMLLALNNAGLQLMPTTIIALRAAAGSADPAGIWGAELVSSLAATGTAVALMSWRNHRRATHE